MKTPQAGRQRIACIVGPTACHKTELAIELAKRTGGEIVSADSVQVYIGMDIGSAKPTQQERQGIAHHLIDCLPIDTSAFSVAMFRNLAAEAIGGIASRGNAPLIVGGSGLYVNALTYPLGFAVPRDESARIKASAAYDADPAAAFERLGRVDPRTAERLHPNDKKRIVRALEVFDCSGKPLSDFGADFQNSAGEPGTFEPLMIGLTMERELLYRRIDLRVERMIEQGLLEEAKKIYEAGHDPDLPALRSIGYRQLFACFGGACTLDGAVAQIKQDTRRFAKRQMTWFRRDDRIAWHDVTDWDSAKDALIERLAAQTRAWMKGTTI